MLMLLVYECTFGGTPLLGAKEESSTALPQIRKSHSIVGICSENRVLDGIPCMK